VNSATADAQRSNASFQKLIVALAVAVRSCYLFHT